MEAFFEPLVRGCLCLNFQLPNRNACSVVYHGSGTILLPYDVPPPLRDLCSETVEYKYSSCFCPTCTRWGRFSTYPCRPTCWFLYRARGNSTKEEDHCYDIVARVSALSQSRWYIASEACGYDGLSYITWWQCHLYSRYRVVIGYYFYF